VSRIAVPTLSRLQDQPERFRRYYLRAVRFVALASMPLIAVLFVVAPEVVLLILGPQWTEAAGLFSIMSVAAFLQPVITTSGWIYVALGQTGRMARWGALFAVIYCASFAIGLPWGARGVALGYTAAVWALAVPGMWAALRLSPVRLGDLVRTVAGPTVLAFACGAAGWMCRRAIAPAGTWSTAITCCAGAAVAAAVVVTVWPALRRDVVGLGAMLRDLRKPAGA
jgi:PST family polysaccharide transporter